MLKKRIIPCLDIQDGRTVKGVNFVNIKDAGCPIELAKKYSHSGADELVLLDITATTDNRKTMVSLVRQIAKEINIHFAVGGGVSTLEDVHRLLSAGADKVCINSAAVHDPNIITDIALEFGSQCLVVAIDTKFANDQWKVYTHGGRKETTLVTKCWTQVVEEKGAGEILLTSMNNDGTHNGFALDITAQVSSNVNIPVIASGGAGQLGHFKELFTHTQATGALAASIFHYQEITLPELKTFLRLNNITIR